MFRFPKFVLLVTVAYLVVCLVVCLDLAPGLALENPTLKTGVSESIYIAPLDPGLAPGRIFDEKKADSLMKNSNPDIEAMRQQSNWYKIPSWLAGRWHKDQTVYTLKRNDRTGQEDRDNHLSNTLSNQSRGTYKDKAGQIWQYEKSCYWYKSVHDKFIHHHFVLVRTPTSITESECAFRSHYICFLVDKKTGKIARCVQWEDESSIRPISASELETRYTLRAFDWHGKLIATEEAKSSSQKTKEFVPNLKRKGPDGKPLYPMFVQYLKDHGLAESIPDAPTLPEGESTP